MPGKTSRTWSTARQRLLALPKQEFGDEPSLLQLSEYEGISLWWFVRTDFFRAVKELDLPATRGSTVQPKPALASLLRGSSLLNVTYLAYQLLASWASRLVLRGPTANGGDRILIVAPNNQWRTLLDPGTARPRKGDFFYDSILHALTDHDAFSVVTVYPINTTPYPWYYPTPGLKTVADRQRHQAHAIHRPFDRYWTLCALIDAWRAAHRFAAVWKGLGPKERFRQDLDIPESAWRQIEDRLRYYFRTVFGRVAGNLAAAQRMVEVERPRLIVMINEYGLFERAVVVAAKRAGVPILAIQHGVIHPTHPGYMYDDDEISRTGSVEAPYCPLPDRTAVYGPYHKDLLTEASAYPKESVVVTGQPRYDVLHSAERMYDRSHIVRELGLERDQRLLLWATQTHGLPGHENEINRDTVYEAVTHLKDVQLVIKLHPGEDQRASLYRGDPRIQPVIAAGDADTYALLYACDLMLTRHSTTAAEAVVLDKPVILLNLSGEPDPVEFVREGVAAGVYQKEDLLPTIEELLRDDSSLANHRKRYVEKYLYRADGKATERVVELMRQMIRGGTDE